MDDLPELDLQKTRTELPPELPSATPPIGLWAAVALGIVAVVVAIYVLFIRRPLPPAVPRPTTTSTTTQSSAPQSLGGRPDQIDIPSLDDSDAVVQMLVRSLSKNPTIETWLATTGLIRNFVVVVENIADGVTPVKHLKPLRPSSPLRVAELSGRRYIDPRSFDRYAVIADAVASVDAAGAARLYANLKPRIEEAYGELGAPDRVFDRTLERAVVVLLRTPIVNESIRVTPKGIGYAFSDERLEDLTAAQKQLLRMGPRSVQRIQDKLREIALALGIPSVELPAR